MSSRGESGEVPFDRVVLSVSGGTRTLSVAEFLELPLTQRIKVVLDRSAVFYHRGAELDRKVALDRLRTRQVVG